MPPLNSSVARTAPLPQVRRHSRLAFDRARASGTVTVPFAAFLARNAQGFAGLAVTSATRATDHAVIAQHLLLAFRLSCGQLGIHSQDRHGSPKLDRARTTRA